MEYRTLGRAGVKVSPLCLGTMMFGGPTNERDSIRIIHKALDAGINFFGYPRMSTMTGNQSGLSARRCVFLTEKSGLSRRRYTVQWARM